MRSWDIELQSTERTYIELSQRREKLPPPKPDLGAKAEKKILKHFWKGISPKGKSLLINKAPKLRKSADKSTIAALMQPLHYDLRCPAAKDNSIMHAAAAPSNLDAAIVYNAILRYWTAKHNRTIATAWEIAPPKPDLGAKAKKKILNTFEKEFSKENHKRLNWENLLANHYRSLDAATPLRFTMSSYKRQ